MHKCRRARATDGAHVGIFRERVLLFDFGNDLVNDHARKAIAQTIVFQTAIRIATILFRLRLVLAGEMNTAMVGGMSPRAIKLSKTIGTRQRPFSPANDWPS